MPEKISVLVIDDYELSRVGLRFMLKRIECVETVDEASNGKELFEKVKVQEPDLVLMDIQLASESGIDLTRQLLRQLPDTLVIAVTASKDIEHFTDMIEAGASGFILKNISQTDLEKAIDEVLNGRMYFSSEFLSAAKKLLPGKSKKLNIKLSDREREVLKLICLGQSNQEIADSLELSSHTVDAHRKHLLSKIGARNTASMITISIQEGLVNLD